MTEIELFAAFGRAVYERHRRLAERSGEPVMCSCNRPVVLCPYRELMGRMGLVRDDSRGSVL